MSDYTRGPWRASKDPGPRPICTMEHENYRENWHVRPKHDSVLRASPEADACFIALAPEMDQTIRGVLFSLETTDSHFFEEVISEAVRKLRWIVAKVDGE